MKLMRKSLILSIVLLLGTNSTILTQAQTPTIINRERLLMDFGWRFAFGHPYDTKKDFNNGTSYFSYIAKAGYGDGPADKKFDDRSWRKLDLPHDWAVEVPFDSMGSHSHGYKAIGRNFPDASVGWYRRSFLIPQSDLGRRITIQFDGVSRNSIVWVNGFYLGTEPSGYSSFEYDITDYLNYGGNNVIAVRADVTMEEGWFYEGAGIYRHVWLNKTHTLHVASNGTFVSTLVKDNAAVVTVRTTIVNDGKTEANFDIQQIIIDATGNTIASGEVKQQRITPLQIQEFSSDINIANPKLWSIDTPYLHKLITTIKQSGVITDQYETNFGIRTIRFDANEGFFLNGKHVKIKGTNNHQEHAGVGTAIPDALQEFRVATLKSFGSNAYRCSHNPPTPELLDICDRLGMLVIDENRLMGTTTQILDQVKRMIIRDRNHPSIIAWSIGNEEWGIEGNVTGIRVASTMQDYVKTIDSTRPVNAAISGGFGHGISSVIEVMGFNYLGQCNTDQHHAKFPNQPGMGTEEGSTYATRGIYVDDPKNQYIAAYDKKPRPSFYTIEEGWSHYASRPYLAGMFIWTGFDYRGESTPYTWPSVSSYFGMLDLCGFPKDNIYYLKSWWIDRPTLHILPHWNWKGREGEEIDVWAHSNCDEVELFLNKKSLGKKTMKQNSHLEWKVKYEPGTLEAIGYKNGEKTTTDQVKTTGVPSVIQMTAHKSSINADREDASFITVQVNDKNNLAVPTANNEITFTLEGPGKIIGVGNGDPTSHEADKYLESVTVLKVQNIKEKLVEDINNRPEVAVDYNNANWENAFKKENEQAKESARAVVYRGTLDISESLEGATVTWFYNSLGKEQSLYINGQEIAKNIKDDPTSEFKIPLAILRQGKNSIAIAAAPFIKKNPWDNLNISPGVIQITKPASSWKRKLFSGLAQIIIQSTNKPGDIIITATSEGLKKSVVKISSKQATLRP